LLTPVLVDTLDATAISPTACSECRHIANDDTAERI